MGHAGAFLCRVEVTGRSPWRRIHDARPLTLAVWRLRVANAALQSPAPRYPMAFGLLLSTLAEGQ
jgi:hypothetical protein